MDMQRTNRDDVEKFDSLYRVSVAMLTLGLFGVLYALAVNWLERHGYMENKSSWYVALGTIVTLFVRYAIMPLGETRLRAMGYTLAAFGFSGVPMMVNQWITKSRVETGFRSRLKDREWIVSRNGHHTEPR